MRARAALLLPVALGVLLLDQLSKLLIQTQIPLHTRIPVIPGLLDLTHIRNPGAAFGLFASFPEGWRTPALIAISLAALVVIVLFVRSLAPDRRLLLIALGLIMGGAAGNLLDRLRFGAVVDFIDAYWRTYHWPAFNVADSAVTGGVIAILLDLWVGRKAEPAQSS
ncbi:MAG: signal peptidase II [Deltaproteobacteria bacterium]|nr:signal peptidase II [Deltaproteobacteria bacterium]